MPLRLLLSLSACLKTCFNLVARQAGTRPSPGAATCERRPAWLFRAGLQLCILLRPGRARSGTGFFKPAFGLLLLLLSWQTVRAQLIPADDFFHEGAQSYITNNVAKARAAVDQGLKFYPDDIKLKKLDELLKQQSQQQQQNQQQKEQQQSQSDQQKDQNKKPEQKDQKKPEPSPDKKDQKDAQQPQKEQKPDESKEPKPDEQGKDGQMSPAEAKKLLDGQKNDEKLMPVSRKDKPPDQQKAIKDW